MLGFIFLVFVHFGVAFVVAASSESETGFTIGEFVDYCEDGIVYWDDLGIPHFTSEPGLWCSMGEDPYILGGPVAPCCPSDMDCLEVGASLYQCGYGDVCRKDMSKVECEDADEYYYDDGDEIADDCWCKRSDFLCDNYINSGDCDDDVLNAASGDCEYKEFECEGSTISTFGCACMWVDIDGEESCQLGTNYEGNHYGYGVIPDAFECFKSSEAGACVDGKQQVTWTVIVNKILGFDPEVPERCLEAADCIAGSEERYCGEPIVKLSGFSLFSLFAALFIIGIYYYNERIGRL